MSEAAMFVREEGIMASKDGWQGEYPVFPTAEGKSNYYSDEAFAALFSAHVDVINSERETIWQRYNIMLAANTGVAGFLGISNEPMHWVRMGTGVLFGWLLCYIWWSLTKAGWDAFDNSCREASKFAWRAVGKYGTKEITYIKELNPIAIQWRGDKPKEDKIKILALRMIKIFALVYFLIPFLHFFGWWVYKN
jgi:hypothetical protein